jgi:hypothetical protein
MGFSNRSKAELSSREETQTSFLWRELFMRPRALRVGDWDESVRYSHLSPFVSDLVYDPDQQSIFNIVFLAPVSPSPIA